MYTVEEYEGLDVATGANLMLVVYTIMLCNVNLMVGSNMHLLIYVHPWVVKGVFSINFIHGYHYRHPLELS